MKMTSEKKLNALALSEHKQGENQLAESAGLHDCILPENNVGLLG